MATGTVTTLADNGEEGDADGAGAAAELGCPSGLALSRDGATLFVADCNNNKIRQLDMTTGVVATLAICGTPDCIAVSCDGTEFLVAFDDEPNRIVLRTTADPPLVNLPSTLVSDLRKMGSDEGLPVGMVSFIVGPEQHRIAHISKS